MLLSYKLLKYCSLLKEAFLETLKSLGTTSNLRLNMRNQMLQLIAFRCTCRCRVIGKFLWSNYLIRVIQIRYVHHKISSSSSSSSPSLSSSAFTFWLLMHQAFTALNLTSLSSWCVALSCVVWLSHKDALRCTYTIHVPWNSLMWLGSATAFFWKRCLSNISAMFYYSDQSSVSYR